MIVRTRLTSHADFIGGSRLNNADDAATHHRVLREHTERLAGNAPAPQRANRDRARLIRPAFPGLARCAWSGTT